MTITANMDPRSMTLEEISNLPISDWIRLKSLYPTRYQQLLDFVEHPDRREDPDHEAWQREQTKAACEDTLSHDAFFSDTATFRATTRDYVAD